ncbi:oxoglutarate-dependent flavonoid 7-O-demethylase 1-like [Tasmannia lanceolata]|uniref:oxoglutarate-dependent flavonoid 7-O-demethylase 1-like n=1 Tax=Tasmannia lanceolata TaxID=3420 RepID=UPI0040635397
MESSQLEILGGSLPVPSVQELVREPIVTVPCRYIRLDQHPPAISATANLPSLPNIDMQRLFQGESLPSELEKLHSACKHWGFFQLVNHGVSYSLIEKTKYEIQNFFKLPLVEKKRFSQQPDDQQGYGQAFVVSEEQKLDWADLFYLVLLPTHQRNSTLFESLSPSFREILEAYSLELKKLAVAVLKMIAKALEMDTEEMREMFEDGYQGMRMNYYPPCPQPEKVVGLTPHSDPGGLTILLQVNEAQGLEIRNNGMWVPVKPLPNAFIVNVGDVVEIISNGAYHSVEHRATVNSVKERLSIATFYSPNLKTQFGPARSLTNLENPPLFRRKTMEAFLKDFFSKELKGKSQVETMKIARGLENPGNTC